MKIIDFIIDLLCVAPLIWFGYKIVEFALALALIRARHRVYATYGVYVLSPLTSIIKRQPTYVWVSGHTFKWVARFHAHYIEKNLGIHCIAQTNIILKA